MRRAVKLCQPMLVAVAVILSPLAHGETVSIVLASNAAPRVEFGAQQVVNALNQVVDKAWLSRGPNTHSGISVLLGIADEDHFKELERAGQLNLKRAELGREGFKITTGKLGGRIAVIGRDDSGVLYGCLELAKRIRQAGQLPREIDFSDKPVMTLRGTCVGMQKTCMLPGRKIYDWTQVLPLYQKELEDFRAKVVELEKR